MHKSFDSIIKEALEYLKSKQKRNGRFLSNFSQEKNFLNKKRTNSFFQNALILISLSSVKQSETANKIIDSLAAFIVSQKSKNCTFNFFLRASKEYKKYLYPDDMDDTFCALSGLALTTDKVTPEVLAKAVTVLTSVETTVGGPYTTWLVDKSASKEWKDTDLVVNANIAYFLSLQNVILPKLTRLFDTTIQKKQYESQYYDSHYVIWYFLAKAYKGKYQNFLRQEVLQSLSEEYLFLDPVDIACGVTSLLVLNTSIEAVYPFIRYLITLRSNSHWREYGMFIHQYMKGIKQYGGSAELTTALCIEALSLYINKLEACAETIKPTTLSKKDLLLHRQIVEEICRGVLKFDKNLVSKTKILVEKIVLKDKFREVTLLPYKFYEASKGIDISHHILKMLGIANTYGWLGYTILDDFLDSEGVPENLPLAQFCLRNLHFMYSKILEQLNTPLNILLSTLTAIDKANYWEANRCYFRQETCIKDMVIPSYRSYEILAQKSIGHALGPLILTHAGGYPPSSREYKLTNTFFVNYLIARQLNDDAHDWYEDLGRGYVNAASVKLVAYLKKDSKYRKKTFGEISTDENIKDIFWKNVMGDILEDVDLHAKKAQIALHENDFIKNKTYLDNILNRPLSSAQKAKTERENTIRFLQAYT